MADTHIKIHNVVPRVQYVGNGSTTVFPFEFEIFDETNMIVYLDDTIQEDGYTVDGVGEDGGGAVTFTVAPDVGVKITLLRNVPIERVTDFQEGGTFRPKNLNDDFDRQTAFCQQVAEELSRSVRVGPTSDIEPEEVVNKLERIHQSIDNVDTVTEHIDNVDTTAENIEDVKTAAENMPAIQDAPQQAANAATSSEHSRIWAEGTDVEVQAIGGEHSAKTYSQMISPIQYPTMPTPSATYLNRIIQYVGETTESYTQGYFYKCVEDSSGGTTTYKWESILSGGGSGSGNNLFNFIWSDYTLNDQNWLRADTFSWQLGGEDEPYQEAYQHLVNDITDKVLQTETVSEHTVHFYLADDGHKIVPSTYISEVESLYNDTGIAWYYVIDLVNQQFKLPRTKYGFNGLRDAVGKYIPDGLPEIPTVSILNHTGFPNGSSDTGNGKGNGGYWRGWEEGQSIVKSDDVYGTSDVVQQRATQMYLYFYIGKFSKSATEQTAGLNSEMFNGKVDVDSLKECHTVIETYHSVTEWYRLYDDGWIEQGGLSASTAPKNITLLKEMVDPNYSVSMTIQHNAANADIRSAYVYSKTTTGFVAYVYNNNTVPVYWEVKGYAAL